MGTGISKLKLATILLILVLMVPSLTAVKAISVESIPKPSVPEFTLRLVEHPYDVAPTTTIDPYTGETVTTQAGYHVENKSIEVTIKNQPFVPYKDVNGSYITMHYRVHWKGHFEDNWHVSKVGASCCTMNAVDSNISFVQPNAPLTVLSYGLGDTAQYDYSLGNISSNSQIDFQVKLFIGKYVRVYGDPVPPFGTPYNDVFEGEESGFSNIQTISISTTDALLLMSIAVIAVVALLLAVVSLLLYRRHHKTHRKLS